MEETKPQNNNTIVMGAIVVLIVVLIGGFFFMQSKGKSEPAPTIEQESTQTESTEESTTQEESTETTTADEVQTVTMEAGSFYYKPNVIKAKVGEKIKVVMTSKDMMHDFNIDELNVKIPVTKSGNTAEVEFTVDKAGTFEFYCSVGQHRKQGQVGQLIVE